MAAGERTDKKSDSGLVVKILHKCLEGASRNELMAIIKAESDVLGDILADLVLRGYLRAVKGSCVNCVVYTTTRLGKEELARLMIAQAWKRG